MNLLAQYSLNDLLKLVEQDVSRQGFESQDGKAASLVSEADLADPLRNRNEPFIQIEVSPVIISQVITTTSQAGTDVPLLNAAPQSGNSEKPKKATKKPRLEELPPEERERIRARNANYRAKAKAAKQVGTQLDGSGNQGSNSVAPVLDEETPQLVQASLVSSQVETQTLVETESEKQEVVATPEIPFTGQGTFTGLVLGAPLY